MENSFYRRHTSPMGGGMFDAFPTSMPFSNIFVRPSQFRETQTQTSHAPFTTRVEMRSFLSRSTRSNPDGFETFFEHSTRVWPTDEHRSDPHADLSRIDYTTLPVMSYGSAKGLWMLALEEIAVDEYLLSIKDTNLDHRQFAMLSAPPTSAAVLQLVQRAMARPLAPLDPALPWSLFVPMDLRHHMPTLRPFLDTLPAPFGYRVGDPALHASVSAEVERRRHERLASALAAAERHKDAGNAALGRGDRVQAVTQYGEGLEDVESALDDADEGEELGKVQRVKAVLYANRAAAYLHEGEGKDARRALREAESAEAADRTYFKVYFRQARAYESLGKLAKAVRVVKHALATVPELKGNRDLTELLEELRAKGVRER